ncbi:hypothetical protein Tco_1136465 [Tanacetum coccineum]
METCEPADTPMVEKSKLDEDPQVKAIDPTRYCGMIGTLMYLTSSRPDLVFVVCMCARYQAKPSEKHLHASDSPQEEQRQRFTRKKIVDDSQETVDVSEESKPKPELVKKKNAIRRVVKKKVTIFADENIIPDPDVALELGKSISLAEAEEEAAAKQVHATHARIMTESVPESAKKKTGSRSCRS